MSEEVALKLSLNVPVCIVGFGVLTLAGCSRGPTSPSVVDGLTGQSRFALVEVSPDEMQSFQDASANRQSAYDSASRVLAVQFAPQVPPGDWSITMSCGPAAVNMATAYLWGANLDQATYIHKIGVFLGKRDPDNMLPDGTTTADLVAAAAAVNNAPNTYKASGWTITRIRQEIDGGRPVVVAVHAGSLPNRGYSYTGGHFVLVVGYDSANMIAQDPGTSRGALKSYANTDFTNAMSPYGGAVVVAMR